jgi:hypothetical protein
MDRHLSISPANAIDMASRTKSAKARAIERLFASMDAVAAKLKDGPPYKFDRDEIYEERLERYKEPAAPGKAGKRRSRSRR